MMTTDAGLRQPSDLIDLPVPSKSPPNIIERTAGLYDVKVDGAR